MLPGRLRPIKQSLLVRPRQAVSVGGTGCKDSHPTGQGRLMPIPALPQARVPFQQGRAALHPLGAEPRGAPHSSRTGWRVSGQTLWRGPTHPAADCVLRLTQATPFSEGGSFPGATPSTTGL